MARRGTGIPGLSFSWRRALGISAAKGRLSRQLGVPLTRSGRQRKAGAALGCCVALGGNCHRSYTWHLGVALARRNPHPMRFFSQQPILFVETSRNVRRFGAGDQPALAGIPFGYNERVRSQNLVQPRFGSLSPAACPCKLLKGWSGRPDSNRRRPAWERVGWTCLQQLGVSGALYRLTASLAKSAFSCLTPSNTTVL